MVISSILLPTYVYTMSADIVMYVCMYVGTYYNEVK